MLLQMMEDMLEAKGMDSMFEQMAAEQAGGPDAAELKVPLAPSLPLHLELSISLPLHVFTSLLPSLPSAVSSPDAM